ncbi:MAG: regulatory iron-sulfur-containing complex subunit RicT [Brevinema sp.]
MIHLVKARTFYDNNIKYYRIDSSEPLQKGDVYVGETRFGNDLLEIHCPSRNMISQEEWDKILEDMGLADDKKKSRTAYEPIIQFKAKESDIAEYYVAKKEAENLFTLFKQKIEQHNLSMKILKLHFTYHREKLVCSYTADQRVDFREYVKDIGSQLHIRIEMFQISPKDAVSFMNTCGACGLRLCCLVGCNLVRVPNSSERREGFNSKSAGVCGKNKCCHTYEIPQNMDMSNPEVGGYVKGPNGMYVVKALNPSRNQIFLTGPTDDIECHLDEIHKVQEEHTIFFEYYPHSTSS